MRATTSKNLPKNKYHKYEPLLSIHLLIVLYLKGRHTKRSLVFKRLMKATLFKIKNKHNTL